MIEEPVDECFVRHWPGAIDNVNAKEWLNAIKDGTDWQQPSGMPRRTAWLTREGCQCPYSYSKSFTIDAAFFTTWMHVIFEEIMPMCGIHEAEQWPNSCNVNLYEGPRSSVDWHRDSESMFQGSSSSIRIISLSLGGARTFLLKDRRSSQITSVKLFAGDLLVMDGRMQQHYLHKVPKASKDNQQEDRINLTWRWVVGHHDGCPRHHEPDFKPGSPSE